MSDLIRREDALALRDKLADIIGALPMSSIHSALSEYRNAIRALPAVQHDAEHVAFSMWKAEADRAAPNVGKNRTLDGFMVAAEAEREKWLGLADAAIRSMKGVKK